MLCLLRKASELLGTLQSEAWQEKQPQPCCFPLLSLSSTQHCPQLWLNRMGQPGANMLLLQGSLQTLVLVRYWLLIR